MKESNQQTENESSVEMRIVRLDNDKTRRVDGSDRVYDVYFEMEGSAPQSWGTIFEGEWKLLNVAHPDLWQAARVDRSFLIMRCPLDDVVALHLPFLKKAVATTNVKYAQYARVIAKERSAQRLIWERESSAVEAVARLAAL